MNEGTTKVFITEKYSTLIGFMGLLMWASTGTMVYYIKAIPTFQILSIVFFISFIVGIIFSYVKKELKEVIHVPCKMWIVGFISIFGNEIFYILSYKHAPASHVGLIYYVWPFMLIVYMSIFSVNKSFSFKYIIAGLIAFSGIYILLTDMKGVSGFKSEFSKGYLYSFLSASLWALYTLYSKDYKNSLIPVMAIYCFCSFVCSAFIHYRTETFVFPQTREIIIMTVLGFSTYCFAYFLWSIGIKHGNINLLSLLSYTNPIISTTLFVFLGVVSPSKTLLFASALIFLSGTIGMVKFEKFKKVRS